MREPWGVQLIAYAITDARTLWRQATAAERWLLAGGLALMAGGAALLVPWAARGDGLAGPLSWRKPVLFGLATGATLVSFGWALRWLRRPRDLALAIAVTLAAWIEVGLIALQCARGRPSHYLAHTPADGWLLAAIEVSALLLLLATVVLTARGLRPMTTPAADVALALRAGLLLLLASVIVGAWMSLRGPSRVAAGAPPELFGPAGVLKFWHGIALHAPQWLPLLAWLGWRRGLDLAARWCVVALASAGQLLAFVYAALQVLRGRGRADLDGPSGVLLAAAALTTGAALLILARGAAPHRAAGSPAESPR